MAATWGGRSRSKLKMPSKNRVANIDIGSDAAILEPDERTFRASRRRRFLGSLISFAGPWPSGRV